MDPFYTFLVFAVVLVLEQLAGQAWLAPYFRLGVPVFFARRAWDQPVRAGDLAKALEPIFHGRPEHPSMQFKAIGDQQVAARERLFENRGGFRYLPIMHSTLRLNPANHSLTLTGYLNWYVLVALVYLVYRAVNETSFVPVAILILFVLGISYVAQAGVFQRVLQTAGENKLKI